MQLFNRYVSLRNLTVFGCELLLIFGSLAIAARVHSGVDADLTPALWKMAFVTGLCLVCFYYNDLYDLNIVRSSRELLIRLLQAAGAASILIALLYLVAPSLALGHQIFVSSLVIFLIAIVAWRLVFQRLAYASQLEQRVLVVGTGPIARMIAREMQNRHEFGYRIVGFVSEQQSAASPERGVIGRADDIPHLVETLQIDRIVVGISDRRGHLPTSQLLSAKLAGARVEDATNAYERLTGKILVDNLKPSWLIFSDGFVVSRPIRVVKRAADLVLASVAFVVFAPFTVLTALAVYLESSGPVFYCQERVGENGKPFTLFKFRSMRVDAEQTGTPVWAQDGDERVTRIGRIIRTTRLDELPQLWNVIRGDMSFVGPRPERPYFVEQLASEIPFYQQRHSVKPGLTGWAQVNYRYGSSVEDAIEKLRYDLYYIKHVSIALDLSIVFDTVKVILFGRGAK
jgi:sugar transferase (PEP-CTERM system associated)